MKMSRDDYVRLAEAIYAVTPAIRNPVTYGMRARWDALWRAVDARLINVNDLYKVGLNDDHIDTALRRILMASSEAMNGNQAD